MRKVIQIAVIPETDNSYAALYALCDDGTLWVRLDKLSGAEWQIVDPIPQDD